MQQDNTTTSSKPTITLASLIRKKGMQVGDIVHMRGAPHYIYDITDRDITVLSMDERKEVITLRDE